jgi:hypothetical protein
MEAKKLNTLIKAIGTSAAKAREQIQQALIGCAYQATFHRNTDPFNRLFEAVGNGTRKEGMWKWAHTHAPIRCIGDDIKINDKSQKEMIATLTEAGFAEKMAKAPLWCDLARPEPKGSDWDAYAFATKLALHLEQAAKKADKAGDSALAELIKDAEMLFRIKLNAATYDVVEVEAEAE